MDHSSKKKEGHEQYYSELLLYSVAVPSATAHIGDSRLKFNFRTRDISVGFRKRDSLQLSGMDSFFSGHSLSSFHWEVPDSFSF